jgi:pimeloyl-ACP methyl ester carboxylesterase
MSATPAPGRLQIGGASLVYQTIDAAGGGSMPFMFQHGLGGDANQPLGYIGNTPPSPVISLNARGHAPSSDIDPAAATFDTFADDVIALADQLELARFIVGGISLGAGTALNLAIRYPDRVAALVLCRPAWLDRPQAEFNQHAYAEIADLLKDSGGVDHHVLGVARLHTDGVQLEQFAAVVFVQRVLGRSVARSSRSENLPSAYLRMVAS